MKSAASAHGAAPRAARHRVAVINTHPIQYFAPLYAYLTEHCPEIDLEVLYLSDWSLRDAVDPGFATNVRWDIDLLSGYRSRFVGARCREVVPAGFWSLRTLQLWREIRHGEYDLVWLHGYGHAALLLALMAARLSGAKSALRGDSHLLLNPPGLRRVLRNVVVSRLLRGFDALFAVGDRNRDYYRYLGVDEKRIHSMPYAIDNARFASALRMTHEGPPRILFASKLIERKDPATLILAIDILRSRGIDVVVEIAGSGPAEAELRNLVDKHDLGNIRFRGFVNQQDMPGLLASADIFVLTSNWEPFGLIVNEAIAAGLLAVVSHDLGCSIDLVEEGINGCRVRSGCPTELADALQRLVEARARWPEMRAAAGAKLSRFSFAGCAAGLREALAE